MWRESVRLSTSVQYLEIFRTWHFDHYQLQTAWRNTSGALIMVRPPSVRFFLGLGVAEAPRASLPAEMAAI